MLFDTRLDGQDWRFAQTPGQLESMIRRLDVVVTTRMHGLVLALKNGIPALAVDPIAERRQSQRAGRSMGLAGRGCCRHVH
ncbi:MAG: hypothetical protein DLM62_19660 [Pseudonocardiales bacterium]|nr:MAG: hypothetical protein DLM62_19660 [Pseudonocardiales bacterium]